MRKVTLEKQREKERSIALLKKKEQEVAAWGLGTKAGSDLHDSQSFGLRCLMSLGYRVPQSGLK